MQGCVYLSLVLGNILAGVGSIRTAIDVVRRYRAIQKEKPVWSVALSQKATFRSTLIK